jgi:hypothetical protein
MYSKVAAFINKKRYSMGLASCAERSSSSPRNLLSKLSFSDEDDEKSTQMFPGLLKGKCRVERGELRANFCGKIKVLFEYIILFILFELF